MFLGVTRTDVVWDKVDGPETDRGQVGWHTRVTSINQSEASVVTCDQSEAVSDDQETITSFSVDTPGCSLMSDDDTLANIVPATEMLR